MIYASVARGYKPGGANGSNGQFLIPATFQPETNDSFEIGSKNMFLDHTLRLNASVFYYMHKQLPVYRDRPDPVRRRHLQHAARRRLRRRVRGQLRVA